MKTIDLRSDTFTLPTDEMIEAINIAHKTGRLGDDVHGEDEVVIELQEKAAKILGITRGSLRNKTHSLGIKIGQVVSAGEADDDGEGEE